MCRKTTFIIDDNKYFQNLYGLTDEQAMEILTTPTFQAIYIMCGNGNKPDKCKLVDLNGNKINLDTLDIYKKDIVIDECEKYFKGIQKHKPCGVVEMEEVFVNQYWMVKITVNKINGEIIGEIQRIYAEDKPSDKVSISIDGTKVFYRHYYKTLSNAKAWRTYWMDELIK